MINGYEWGTISLACCDLISRKGKQICCKYFWSILARLCLSCMGASRVRLWVKHIRGGKRDIANLTRSDRPRTANTECNEQRSRCAQHRRPKVHDEGNHSRWKIFSLFWLRNMTEHGMAPRYISKRRRPDSYHRLEKLWGQFSMMPTAPCWLISCKISKL
jgi:hypothetical protein